MSGQVFRCSNCAAPLAGAQGGVAVCEYCDAENHLGMSGAASGATLFAEATRDADKMAKENEAKLEELQERFETLYQQAIENGSADTAQRAINAFEGYLRLTYAPTIHMYRSMSPADPSVQEGLQQIDDALDQALASFAEALPCDYVPVGQRLQAT